MYSKQLISLTAILLSSAACSSDPSDGVGGMTGSGGNTATGGSTAVSGAPGTSGGVSSQGGAFSSGGAQPSSGGSLATSGGTSNNGGSAGRATMGGSSGSATGGASGMGPTGNGGASPMGGGGNGGPKGGMGGTSGGAPGAGGGGAGGRASGGQTSSGGSAPTGGAASFKCDNLSLAPSTTGVAKPSGAAGGLKVLDWAGFKGAVSFTFDDNTPSQMQNYSALKGTGAHFTWFVVGNWLSGSSSTISQYKATIADGQEMANHTYSHQSAGSQSDLQQNESFIMQNFGVTANSMAAPNCDGSWASVAPGVLFQNRGPCGKSAATVSPRDNTSPFQLPAYLPDTGASSSTLTGTYVDGKWRIFVIHGFDSQNGTYQPVPIGNVTAAMSSAISSGYWTEGITNVGAYWQGQKLISASATTSATWTLPAHFPKNMCVRITTTGGTVTQNGQTVPWDDHGYYQIALDAGSVTIQ